MKLSDWFNEMQFEYWTECGGWEGQELTKKQTFFGLVWYIIRRIYLQFKG